MRRALILLAALLALTPPAAAVGQQCPRTTVGDIEDEVMCPVCGTPLNLATDAPQARRERAYIQGLVEQCKSKQEIKTALVAQFGDSVLAVPDDEGFGLAAYLVPALGIALALGGIALAATRWRGGRRPGVAGPAAAGPAPDPRESARLDADLERYDQ